MLVHPHYSRTALSTVRAAGSDYQLIANACEEIGITRQLFDELEFPEHYVLNDKQGRPRYILVDDTSRGILSKKQEEVKNHLEVHSDKIPKAVRDRLRAAFDGNDRLSTRDLERDVAVVLLAARPISRSDFDYMGIMGSSFLTSKAAIDLLGKKGITYVDTRELAEESGVPAVQVLVDDKLVPYKGKVARCDASIDYLRQSADTIRERLGAYSKALPQRYLSLLTMLYVDNCSEEEAIKTLMIGKPHTNTILDPYRAAVTLLKFAADNQVSRQIRTVAELSKELCVPVDLIDAKVRAGSTAYVIDDSSLRGNVQKAFEMIRELYRSNRDDFKDDTQRVLDMRYLEGLSEQQIADGTFMEYTSVRRLHEKGVKRLLKIANQT